MTRSFLVLFLGSLLVLAGCGGGTSRTPLLIYSPHGKEMLQAFEHEFEAAHGDVDVQWLDMGSQDAYDRIRTERTNTQADVWWGGPASTFDKAAQEGLLDPYRPTWAGEVDSSARGSGDFWYGTFLTPEVIMYNSRMISEADAPKEWDDLLQPRWRGKLMMRYPLASGTMRTIFCAMIQRENRKAGDTTAGFRWLQKLDANTKTYVADPTQLYIRIAREEAPVTVWDMPDVELQIHRNAQPFGYVLPAGGTPVLVDGIAIVRGAPHPDLARMFYEFVTSRESLVRQAKDFFRIPTRRDISHSDLPEWITAHHWNAMRVDWQDLAMHEQQGMLYWDEHVKGRGTSESTTP